MSLLAVVVDDHTASVELARYLLTHAGYEVECAGDGLEAHRLITDLRPDVVVLDLDLPKLNGCDLRDRLAADTALATIPLVVVSVHEIGAFCPGLTRADFAEYIRKPLDPPTFAAIVRAAIERGKQPKHDIEGEQSAC